MAFMDDLRSRLANRVQLTTDGHKAYLQAVEGAFGGDIDYAVLHKVYGNSPESAKGKYSPAECVGTQKLRIEGEPNAKHVSTSYIERSNLTMRMHNRHQCQSMSKYRPHLQQEPSLQQHFFAWLQ
jgi:hypothetical protein